MSLKSNKIKKINPAALGFSLKALAPIIVLLAIAGYVYYPTFVWMVERWTAKDSYFAHGFLIPAVSIYWLWSARQLIAQCQKKPQILGLALIVLAAGIQVTSFFLRFYFLSAISFVMLIMGLVYFLYGKAVFRQCFFPIFFLFMMIPLPLLVIAQITLKMKFFVSSFSAAVVSWMGITAVQHGSYIYTPNSVLVVGDPCSGLRSFLAFLALGFVFAYDKKLVWWQKAVLIFSGLPLAIVSNIARVIFLTLVGEIYGMKYTGPGNWPHDVSGIAVFLIAFAAFMGIRKMLEVRHVSA